MNFEEMCACGHVGDEHGGDEQHPGSTACTVEGCPCIAFEWDGEDGAKEDVTR